MVAEIKKPILVQPKPSLKLDNTHSMVEFGEGIASITHFPAITSLIDVQVVLENMSAVNKLSGNMICPLLLDFTAYTSLNPLYTPTARTVLLGSDAAKKRSAIALLFSSEDQIKKAFLFHSSNKFSVPLKMFVHREEAIDWLKTFILN